MLEIPKFKMFRSFVLGERNYGPGLASARPGIVPLHAATRPVKLFTDVFFFCQYVDVREAGFGAVFVGPTAGTYESFGMSILP